MSDDTTEGTAPGVPMNPFALPVEYSTVRRTHQASAYTNGINAVCCTACATLQMLDQRTANVQVLMNEIAQVEDEAAKANIVEAVSKTSAFTHIPLRC